MTAAASRPKDRRPAWLRREALRRALFATPADAALTVGLLALLVWLLQLLLGWAIHRADWAVVQLNSALLLLGRYPHQQSWRLWLLAALLATQTGLSWGLLRASPRPSRNQRPRSRRSAWAASPLALTIAARRRVGWQRVEIEARFRTPHNFQNPGSFDYAAYLARRDIFWTALVPSKGSVRVLPGEAVTHQILLVPRSDIAKLETILGKKGTWVVSLISAANVLKGERQVVAFPDVRPNRHVVQAGDQLATTVLEGDERSPEQVRSRLNLLLAAAFTQAQRRGTLTDGLQFDPSSFNQLGAALSNRPSGQAVRLEAIARRNSDLADPVVVDIRAMQTVPQAPQLQRPSAR